MKVEDIPPAEMHELLMTKSFGHLGCAREGRPYVVPMLYAYDGKELFFYATEGTKTQFMNGNPQVCLQVEEITDSSHWRSVMIIGRAERLIERKEIEHAATQLTGRHHSLATTLKAASPDGDANGVVFYRIRPEIMDGRKTVNQRET